MWTTGQVVAVAVGAVLMGWCGGFFLAALLAASGEADRQERARLSVEQDLEAIRKEGW